MKYYVASDIHGCYDQFIQGLSNTDYDKGNPNHKIIICGDAFDRGIQNKEIYEYIRENESNGNLIYIKGNHDLFINDVYGNPCDLEFNVIHNGYDRTLSEIFIPVSNNMLEYQTKLKSNLEVHDMYKWSNNLPLYYETKNYIFTHAWIPMTTNWRKEFSENYLWSNPLRIDVWNLGYITKGKTLVVGHFHAIKFRNYMGLCGSYEEDYNNHNNHKPFHMEFNGANVIAIDNCVNYHMKPIEILVIEDEELPN